MSLTIDDLKAMAAKACDPEVLRPVRMMDKTYVFGGEEHMIAAMIEVGRVHTRLDHPPTQRLAEMPLRQRASHIYCHTEKLFIKCREIPVPLLNDVLSEYRQTGDLSVRVEEGDKVWYYHASPIVAKLVEMCA